MTQSCTPPFHADQFLLPLHYSPPPPPPAPSLTQPPPLQPYPPPQQQPHHQPQTPPSSLENTLATSATVAAASCLCRCPVGFSDSPSSSSSSPLSAHCCPRHQHNQRQQQQQKHQEQQQQLHHHLSPSQHRPHHQPVWSSNTNHRNSTNITTTADSGGCRNCHRRSCEETVRSCTSGSASGSGSVGGWRRHGRCVAGSRSSPSCWPHSPLSASVASKTLLQLLGRTFLALPALPLLLLLRLRRKGRRHHHHPTQVPRLLLTVCLLTMLTSHCLAASPWVEETSKAVKLRARFCQPVPDEHLRSMLGSDFDSRRMFSQDPRAAAGKRGDPSGQDATGRTGHVDPYYMEDDPSAGTFVDEDFVDVVTTEEGPDWIRRKEEVEVDLEDERSAGDDNLAVEEKDWEEVVDASEGFYQTRDVETSSSVTSSSLSRRRPDPRWRGRGSDRLYPYMRRRRRAAPAANSRRRYYRGRGPAVPTTSTTTSSSSSSSNGDSAAAAAASAAAASAVARTEEETGGRQKKGGNRDSLLPLRLLLSGKNRKLRRKLKKVFRKKARKLSQKPPPWTCELESYVLRLKEDYWPRYLLDGRCKTDKCFYRLYDCRPQKYRVRVLERDPNYCNPLPTTGLNTTYEQKWSVRGYYVTAGCNCQAAETSSRRKP